MAINTISSSIKTQTRSGSIGLEIHVINYFFLSLNILKNTIEHLAINTNINYFSNEKKIHHLDLFCFKRLWKKEECILCPNQKKNKCFSTINSATTQLWDHLRAIHHKEWEDLQQQKTKKEENGPIFKQLNLFESNEQCVQEYMKKAIVCYIDGNYVSFATVESSSFQNLFSLFHYVSPCRRSIVSLVDKNALEVRTELQKFIRTNTQYIACTADGWVDEARHHFFCCNCAFY